MCQYSGNSFVAAQIHDEALASAGAHLAAVAGLSL
jgi:hypothetical protein